MVPYFNLYGWKHVKFQQDVEIIKKLSSAPSIGQEKIRQQGAYESLYRDLIVGYGDWEFDPTEIFPKKEGSVHLWQGCEDRIIPFEINLFLSKKLQWIRYHEVLEAGHFLMFDSTLCEAVLREFLSS